MHTSVEVEAFVPLLSPPGPTPTMWRRWVILTLCTAAVMAIGLLVMENSDEIQFVKTKPPSLQQVEIFPASLSPSVNRILKSSEPISLDSADSVSYETAKDLSYEIASVDITRLRVVEEVAYDPNMPIMCEYANQQPDRSLVPTTHELDILRLISTEDDSTLLSKDIAIVTMLPATVPGQTAEERFATAELSLQNMVEYATRHGYPFFFANDRQADDEMKHFHSKVDIVEKYLDYGYHWVLWTDVDVLLTNHAIPLHRILPSTHHVVVTTDCVSPRRNPLPGFIAIRNTPQGRCFLNMLRSMYDTYRNRLHPEISALEDLVTLPGFRDMVFWNDPIEFHVDEKCLEWALDALPHAPFSIRFTSADKVARLASVFEQWQTLGLKLEPETPTPAFRLKLAEVVHQELDEVNSADQDSTVTSFEMPFEEGMLDESDEEGLVDSLSTRRADVMRV